MCHKIPLNSSIFTFLTKIDCDFLEQTQKAGCSCGGKLYKAHYPRSPMGIPKEWRQYFEERLSLCCGRCRRRTAVATIRFFGRRWYPAPVFLFISLLQKKTGRRQIKKRFGISLGKSTWKRWRIWWREHFITTAFWEQERGKFIGKALLGPYPKSLFQVLSGSFEQRMLLLLQFLAPLTAGILRAV
jgi:hypothetical protein